MSIAEKVKQAALAQNDPAIRKLFSGISDSVDDFFLLGACYNDFLDGKSNAFRFLTGLGVDINAQDGEGQSILAYAAGAKSEDGLRCVKEIVDCGGDIHQTDNDGWSAAFFAAHVGNLPALRWLVERGADIHDTAENERNLHFVAVSCDDSVDLGDAMECMKWLDAMGLSITGSRDDAQPLLIWSVMQSSDEMALFLIEQGVPVDELDQDNKTALMLACMDGHEVIVQALIQAGADLEILDENEDSALYYACKGNQPEVVSMMLGAGANADFSPEKIQKLKDGSTSDACLLVIDAFKARKTAQLAIDGIGHKPSRA